MSQADSRATSATNGAPHVSFRGTRKACDGKHRIVSDLNLGIHRRDFLTLLGPSVSGKITCLMMLAGLETPTAGEIRLGDSVINTMSLDCGGAVRAAAFSRSPALRRLHPKGAEAPDASVKTQKHGARGTAPKGPQSLEIQAA